VTTFLNPSANFGKPLLAILRVVDETMFLDRRGYTLFELLVRMNS
jgi:hypothetical protein